MEERMVLTGKRRDIINLQQVAENLANGEYCKVNSGSAAEEGGANKERAKRPSRLNCQLTRSDGKTAKIG